MYSEDLVTVTSAHLDVLNARLEQLSLDEILEWVCEVFSIAAMTVTGGKGGVILSLKLQQLGLIDQVTGFFINTGEDRVMNETRQALEEIKDRYGLRVEELIASEEELERTADFYLDSDRVRACCDVRKSAPYENYPFLNNGYLVMLNGRNNINGGRKVPVVEIDDRHKILKVNPLAVLSKPDFEALEQDPDFVTHGATVPDDNGRKVYDNPGCETCTARLLPSEVEGLAAWEIRQKTRFPLHPELAFCGMHQSGEAMKLGRKVYERLFRALGVDVPREDLVSFQI